MVAEQEMVQIRQLRISDIYALNRMYDSLSELSKHFFRPGFLGFSSINLDWFVDQCRMAFSSIDVIRKLVLQVYPSAALIAIVSTDCHGRITGFAFIKRNKPDLNGDSFGRLGICVKDGYRGRHIGSGLMDFLLTIAKKESLKKIFLAVENDNTNAVSMYKKFNFKKIKTPQNRDIWAGRLSGSFEMMLSLDDS